MLYNCRVFFSFLILLIVGACVSATPQAGFPSEPAQGASRAELDAYAISIIQGADGGANLVYDGRLVQAIITASNHLKEVAAPTDAVRKLPTRLIAISETENSYRLGFFPKMYPSSEVVGDIYPNGVCEGYCYRFGDGKNYIIEVDKKTQEIISVRVVPN